MDKETHQRLAVSALLCSAEKIADTAGLPIDTEMRLRFAIARTLAAFNMPSKHEREPENVRGLCAGEVPEELAKLIGIRS